MPPIVKYVTVSYLIIISNPMYGQVNGGISSVSAAMKTFLRPEKLSAGNEWRCDGCKNKVKATKQMKIYQTPNVLVLHLKRFAFSGFGGMMAMGGMGGMGGKINKPIEFTPTIEVPCSNPDPVPGAAAGGSHTVPYELHGVVVHHGHSVHSGHYIAYVKAPNGQWHEMNDSTVTLVPLSRVRSYVLLCMR